MLLDGVFRSMGQQLSTPAAAALAAPEGALGEAAAAAAGSGGASAVGPHSAPPVPHGSATAAAPVRVEQPTAAAQQPQQAQRPQQEAALQGAYLWGEVGSGKTLLMNAYHRASESLLPSPAAQQAQQAQRAPDVQQSTATSRAAVRRTHFHAFMVDVHKRLHDLHQRVPRVAGKSRQGLPVFRQVAMGMGGVGGGWGGVGGGRRGTQGDSHCNWLEAALSHWLSLHCRSLVTSL